MFAFFFFNLILTLMSGHNFVNRLFRIPNSKLSEGFKSETLRGSLGSGGRRNFLENFGNMFLNSFFKCFSNLFFGNFSQLISVTMGGDQNSGSVLIRW